VSVEVAGGPLGLQEHEELVKCRGLSVGGAWRDESWSASATGLQSVSSSGQSSRMWTAVWGCFAVSSVGPKCASVESRVVEPYGKGSEFGCYWNWERMANPNT